MERHWTLELVAGLGLLAGFVLATRDATALAGAVTAASAYALLLPAFVDSPAPAESSLS